MRTSSSGTAKPRPPETGARLERLYSEGYRFDAKAADHAVKFFEKYLVHIKGQLRGKPFLLRPWQKEQWIWPLFGWKRPNGTRRFREGYVELPRKNGKSSLGAGCGNYLTFADREPGAEIYAAATKKEQAMIVFNTAKSMVRKSPKLARYAQILKQLIWVPHTDSIFRPVGSRVVGEHGLNSSGNIIDELHAHANREMYDVLVTGTAGRTQPLTLSITTAGYDRLSLCWELHDYAEKVNRDEGESALWDPAFFGLIYAAGEKDDWTDPRIWAKANPNLGVSVDISGLEDECRKAQQLPARQNSFRRLRLNQWTQQSSRWMPMDKWDETAFEVDREALRGMECYGGLDLGRTRDLCAFVLTFRVGENIKDLPFFWIPEENMRERMRKDRVPYPEWIKKGLVTATPGNVIDYKYIRATINELGKEFRIQQIGFDPWRATQITQELQEDDGFEMVEMRQGYGTLGAPTTDLMNRVLLRQLHHGGHPVMRWMADNMAIRQDPAGNEKPDKAKSTSHIDGMVALIMALDRLNRKQGGGKSVYETRGVIRL